jgi:hypothetical protein
MTTSFCHALYLMKGRAFYLKGQERDLFLIFIHSNISRVYYKDLKNFCFGSKISRDMSIFNIISIYVGALFKLKMTKKLNLYFVLRRPVYDLPFDFLKILCLC